LGVCLDEGGISHLHAAAILCAVNRIITLRSRHVRPARHASCAVASRKFDRCRPTDSQNGETLDLLGPELAALPSSRRTSALVVHRISVDFPVMLCKPQLPSRGTERNAVFASSLANPRLRFGRRSVAARRRAAPL